MDEGSGKRVFLVNHLFHTLGKQLREEANRKGCKSDYHSYGDLDRRAPIPKPRTGIHDASVDEEAVLKELAHHRSGRDHDSTSSLEV